MYRNQLIFSPVHAKGQQFVSPKENGDVLSQYAIANIGYIAGNKRTIDAIMTDLVSDGDKWHLFNIVNADNIYSKTVAVLGVSDTEKGRYLALRYCGESLGVGMQANWIGEFSYSAIKRFLDHDQSTYTDRIKASDIEHFEKFITDKASIWSEEKLISHNGNLGLLMLDMLQNDEEGQLLDSMSASDFAEFTSELQDNKDQIYLIEDEQLDALITPYGRLDILIQRLSQAIGKVGNSKVNVTSITPTKPFKRNGVVNVAVMLQMDDGQTVSIVFHNPDATPSKLANADVLTSWKWLLNKRDVSVVLQPQNGENVNLNQIAVRMMQLVNKNSARFKRTQVKRAENEKELQALQQEEQSKTEQLAKLDADIAELQAKIDAANTSQEVNQPDESEVKEVDQEPGDIFSKIKNATKQNALKLANELVEFSTAKWELSKTLEDIKGYTEDEFRRAYHADLEKLDQQYKDVINGFSKLASVAYVKDVKEIESLANEAHSNYKSKSIKGRQLSLDWYEMGEQYKKLIDKQIVEEKINQFGEGKEGFSGSISSLEQAETVKDLDQGSWKVLKTESGYAIAYNLPDDSYSISEFAPSLEEAYSKMLESKASQLKHPDDQNALVQEQEENANPNADIEFLNGIKSGDVDLSDMEGVATRMTDIWTRIEGGEHENLFNEASEIISQFALNMYQESVA